MQNAFIKENKCNIDIPFIQIRGECLNFHSVPLQKIISGCSIFKVRIDF